MRYIAKSNQTPTCLQQLASPADAEEAQRRWQSFKEKEYLQEALLAEQYHLCCYSEVRADILELGYHIEHVAPKSLHPQRTFDYRNLAASALHGEQLAKLPKKEHFGGHVKLNKYDAALFISCHEPECAKFFTYLSDGRCVPHKALTLEDKARAKYTIACLNLNSPFLVAHRQRWWDELEQLAQQHEADDWCKEHLAAVDLIPGRLGKGKLSPFFSLNRQFFGKTAEKILRELAPNLL